MKSELLVKETRIFTKCEVVDISITKVEKNVQVPHGIKYSFNYRVRTNSSGWKTLIRFDNVHVVKGHCKRDHKHVFNNDAVEVEFISPKHIYNELLDFIEQNRGVIDETKRR